ncbi:MAG: tetratricopeptide repeat protein [Myxococcota bacterium]
MYKIIIEDDEGRITQVPFRWPEITIGRKEGNVIRLTERNVSRFHAKIIKENQGIVIQDLDSYNGVKINGDRIHGKAFIKDGDIIHIGDYKIILKYEQDRDEITQELPPTVQKKIEESFQPPVVSQAQAPVQEEITPIKKAPEPQYESTAVIRMPSISTPLNQEAQEIPDSTARLVLFAGHLPEKEFSLNKTVMKIGRTEENDIVLDHKSISREHAQIIYENNSFKIIDLKSANGVLVNGEQYAKTELRNGDIIELGHLKLKFIDERSPQVYQETAVVRMPQRPKEEKAEVEVKEPFYDDFSKTEPVVIKKKPIGLIIGGIIIAIVAVVAIIFLLPKGEKGPTQETDLVYKQKLEDIQRNMLAANWGEAKNQLSVLANQYPDDKDIQQLLSKATMEEKTKENYDKAIASLSLKNWDDAWKRFNSIPKDSYYYQLAIKEMTSLKSNYIDYHLRQGMAFAKEKKRNMALAEFNLVLELDPSNEMALKEKARLIGEGSKTEPQIAMQQKEAQNVKEAERRVEKREEEKTSQSPSKVQKAITKAETQPSPKGKEQPKETESAEPTAEDYTTEGNKLLMKNRIAEAIANYQKAIKLKPNLAAAHRSLGVAYTKIGQVDKAAKEYETYLKLQPDAPDANQVRQILEQYYKSKGQ